MQDDLLDAAEADIEGIRADRPPGWRGQYSRLMTKNDPRIVPASFDF